MWRTDLHKLREPLGAPRRLRPADEAEVAREVFPSLEVVAVPPFGRMVPAAEMIDRPLLDSPRILCPAGDHRQPVLVDPRDVVRVTAAHTTHICKDWIGGSGSAAWPRGSVA